MSDGTREHSREVRAHIAELQRQLLDLDVAEDRARVHLELGRIWLGEGRLEPAIRHFREALLLDRRLDQARSFLADLGVASNITVVGRGGRRREAVKALLVRVRRKDRSGDF